MVFRLLDVSLTRDFSKPSKRQTTFSLAWFWLVEDIKIMDLKEVQRVHWMVEQTREKKVQPVYTKHSVITFLGFTLGFSIPFLFLLPVDIAEEF